MEAIEEWTRKNFITSTLILIVTVAYISHRIIYQKRNVIPGPIGLPIVGYLPFLRRNAAIKLHKLKEKYGSIFGLYLGNKYAVVLSDYQSIVEGLNNPFILGRPPNLPFDVINTSKYTESGFGGKSWLKQRGFILHVLRDLGYGKNKMEKFITDEITYFIRELKSREGKPCFPAELLIPSVSNNICFFAFGKRLDYDDPERIMLDNSFKVLARYFSQAIIYSHLPWLKFIKDFFGLSGLNKVSIEGRNIRNFLLKEVEEHKRNLDMNNDRDFIDKYLIRLNELRDSSETFFSYDMLLLSIQFLLTGGSTTVKETLIWCLLIMTEYTSIQTRVRKEIDEIVGRHRQPSWADRLKLVYTQAVIYEIQRWRSIASLNLFRYCREDTIIKGYKIPKGSNVIANLWSVHNDVDYWKDPEVFRPERFLDESGTKIVRHDYFIPFSTGRMSCPGEGMAKMELFLYFSTIMQKFIVKAPEGKTINLEANSSLIYFAEPQKLCFIERE